MAWKFPRIAVIAIGVTVALWLGYLSRDRFYRQQEPEPVVEEQVPRYEVWGIKDLSEVIQVSSLRVRPRFEDVELPIKQETNLTITFNDVDLAQPVPNLPAERATIVAPTHQLPDASSLIIGMATKLGRLFDSLPSISHWASGTNAKFVVVYAPPEPGEISVEEIEQLYKNHNIRITLIESSAPWYDQYVSLLAVLYDHAESQTKWGVLMDDDTYFFSMKRLLAMLDKYNANEPYYIGGLTENKEGIDRIGLLAYGGAGIFLSLPLLKQLRPYNDDCIAMPDDAGDIRTSHCITTYSTTKFTWEHYLFQMDMHGDVTGFYEAARTRPVSTHHWKTWHFHDMANVGAVGEVCGNECVLQKYVTADGWMLTNGFSIVKYSWTEEENAKYIEGAMEHTWADTIWVIPTSWNYTLAPLRPKDEGKVQYVIEKVEEDNQTMTIYYVRRRNGIGEGIVRMTWERSPATGLP